jgi:coenzyme Q-binding protein COQ10
MPRFEEHKVLPYTPEQLFDLVLDIKSYPKFLPWCMSANMRQKNEQEIIADLTIGYHYLHETFYSLVTFERASWIKSHYLHGPFKHLDNHWRFKPHGTSGCEIYFYVDFEFKVGLFNRLANRMFLEITHKMVHAFEERAKVLYGKQR